MSDEIKEFSLPQKGQIAASMQWNPPFPQVGAETVVKIWFMGGKPWKTGTGKPGQENRTENLDRPRFFRYFTTRTPMRRLFPYASACHASRGA